MLLQRREPIISSHRLPQPYRTALAILWLLPPLLLTGALSLGSGMLPLDLRLILPALAMLVPSWYVWREGVDITPSGLIARIQLPRRHYFSALACWAYDARVGVLWVWDRRGRLVLECRAAHLTRFDALLQMLESQLTKRADGRSND